MVKGSEKESNSPSSVNNNNSIAQESSTSVNFQIRNPNLAFIDNENHHTISHGQVIDAEIRSHPAYIAYYYSNVNKNPSLPPPLLSLEEWQIFQRFQEVGEFGGDLRNIELDGGGTSTSSHPYNQMHRGGTGMPSSQKAEDGLIEMRRTAARNLSRISSSDSLDGLCGQSNSGLGARRKSFADILQGVIGKCSTPPSRLSRPASYNSLTDVINRASSTSELENKTKYFDGSSTKAKSSELYRSLRPPPGFPSRSNFVSNDRDEDMNIVNSGSQSPSHKSPDNSSSITSSYSEFGFLNYHEQQKLQQEYNKCGMNNFMSFKEYMNLVMENEVSHGGTNFVQYPSNMERQMNFPQRASSMVNLQSLANASDNYSRLPDTKLVHHQSNNFPKRASSLVNLQSLANSSDSSGTSFTDFTDLGIKLSNAVLEEENSKRNRVLGHSNHHYSTNEQHQTQHDCARNTAAMPRNLSHTRNAISTSYSANDLRELGKVYTEKFLTQEKQQDQQQPHFLYNKPGHINRSQYHGNPGTSTFLCKGNQTAYSARPAAGTGRGGRLQKEGGSRSFNASKNKEPVSPVSRNSLGKATVDGKVALGSLQEMKICKNKSLELSDVLNDVVGFSKDQYGSRFLQQKLETATVEEKTNIFQKIIPHARDLMTDVFGNYVIQKFFENGTEKQRKELANQVIGHVLPLSLQMYGCRVIQKALEVIDMEQKTQVARELDGSVMKCVHDQNGNHVIQKCIECVPQDGIQFIISSFFGQVVALSTHPYGCRVIQRVLEHCHDPHTQSTVMDEILNSVCTLAQDQYGNYVIQYVLQHGKPHERSAIIAKLTGQIVTMSQQKFASNVVEKCLSFAAPEERKLIVNEMLGSTDDNEVLQAMMKDPFGNYVVQKVLETCDDQDRELILSRIRVHLNTLKKYTYGKHIVTRVEKLIEAGEKQTELMSKKDAS